MCELLGGLQSESRYRRRTRYVRYKGSRVSLIGTLKQQLVSVFGPSPSPSCTASQPHIRVFSIIIILHRYYDYFKFFFQSSITRSPLSTTIVFAFFSLS